MRDAANLTVSRPVIYTTWKKRKTLKGRERKGISREVQQAEAEWLKRKRKGERERVCACMCLTLVGNNFGYMLCV